MSTQTGGRLTLLGDLRVDGPCGPLPIPSERARMVLARIGVAEHARVARHRLLHDVWPETAERAARRRLSETLSRIRAAWGDAAAFIVSTPETISLDLDVDLAELRSAARAARTRAEEPVLERIRSLHNGPPAPSLQAEWLDTVRDEVARHVTWSLEHLLMLLRRSGRPQQAETVALELLALDPLRESTVRALLQICALQGRPTDGIAIFRRFQEQLLRDLGEAPHPSTSALARTARRLEDGPPPTPSVHQLPLVGRRRETSTLRLHLERMAHGSVATIALVGPPGSGRSRILQETAASARWRALTVVHCGDQSLAEAIDDALDPLLAEQIATSLDPKTRAEAAAVLASLPGDHLEGGAPLGSVLRALATRRSLVVLIDDADRATDVVHQAVAQLHGHALVVVAGCWVPRLHVDTVIPLEPLHPLAVERLTEEILGTNRADLHRWSGGSARLVVDALTALARGEPPTSRWLYDQLGMLAPETLRFLGTSAALPPLRPTRICHIAEVPETHAAEALATGWVTAVGDTLVPTCPAVHQTALDLLPDTERIRERAEQMGITLYPTPPTDPSTMSAASRTAVARTRAALDRADLDAVDRHLTAALHTDPSPRARSELGALLGARLRLAGRHADARDLHRQLGQWSTSATEQARHLMGEGACDLADRLPEDAVHRASQAIALLKEKGVPRLRHRASVLLGQAALATGDLATAAAAAHTASAVRALVALGRTRDALERAGQDPGARARALAARGRWDDATAVLAEADIAVQYRILRHTGRIIEADHIVRSVDPQAAADDPELYLYAMQDIATLDPELPRTAISRHLQRFRDRAIARAWLTLHRELALALLVALGRWPSDWPLLPGQERVMVPAATGGAIPIVWTPDAGSLDPPERTERRRTRLHRMVKEARCQGGSPTASVLARALDVDPRTIRRDLGVTA